MPKKKIQYELESEPPILLPPEEVYYRKGDVLLLARNLDEWPTIAPHKYSNADVVQLLEDWIEDNHLRDTSWEEWYQCLEPVRGILELSGDERKEFFKKFKSTRQRKLADAIELLPKVLKTLESIDSEIWNEEIRLDYLHEQISQELLPMAKNKLEEYQDMQVALKHTGTGEHVLLQGRLGPFVEKMRFCGLNQDQRARALCGLLQRFKYQPFDLLNKKTSQNPSPRIISSATKPSQLNDKEDSFVKRAELIIFRCLSIVRN